MVGEIHFWLRLLLYVVAFFYMLLTAITIVKNEIVSLKINMVKVKERVYKTRLAVFFFILGWMCSGVASFYHVYRINDVTILNTRSTEDGMEFDMFSPQKISEHNPSGQFTTRFCPDYSPPFKKGLKLSTLVYEDRYLCWSVASNKLGYIFSRVRR